MKKTSKKKGPGQRKEEKVLESWRISDNEDTETLHQLAKEVSRRGGKGSGIKHVGWALQHDMDMENCHDFWILKIFFSLSNKADSPFRRLYPGRPWTPSQKKNQFCFYNASVYRPPFIFEWLRKKKSHKPAPDEHSIHCTNQSLQVWIMAVIYCPKHDANCTWVGAKCTLRCKLLQLF